VWAPAIERRWDVKSSAALAPRASSRRGEPDASGSAGAGSGSSTGARAPGRAEAGAGRRFHRGASSEVTCPLRRARVGSTCGSGRTGRRTSMCKHRVGAGPTRASPDVGVESTGPWARRGRGQPAPHAQRQHEASRCTDEVEGARRSRRAVGPDGANGVRRTRIPSNPLEMRRDGAFGVNQRRTRWALDVAWCTPTVAHVGTRRAGSPLA
jgi:hypothetical protein